MRALVLERAFALTSTPSIIAPTSRAHRVIAAAHDADIDNDTVAGPDSLHLKVAEAIMRSHFEMGLDISHPRGTHRLCAGHWHAPDLAASLLATRNGPRASTPTIRWRCTWG